MEFSRCCALAWKTLKMRQNQKLRYAPRDAHQYVKTRPSKEAANFIPSIPTTILSLYLCVWRGAMAFCVSCRVCHLIKNIQARPGCCSFLLGNAIFISLSQIASREVINKVKETVFMSCLSSSHIKSRPSRRHQTTILNIVGASIRAGIVVRHHISGRGDNKCGWLYY